MTGKSINTCTKQRKRHLFSFNAALQCPIGSQYFEGWNKYYCNSKQVEVVVFSDEYIL